MDGKELVKKTTKHTIPLLMSIDETFDVGLDTRTVVEQKDFHQACRFLDALVPVVQRYGVSSSAMESLLVRVAHALRVQGQFLATPTQVQSILWDDDKNRQRLHISLASAGNYDLKKQVQISELVESVESGATTPADGLARIPVIDRAGPEYGPGVTAVAFVMCGAGFAVMLGLSWVDVLLGGALSIVSFGLTRLAVHSQSLTTVFELVVAAVAAVLATLLALVLPGSSPVALTVCACIWFVPGFGLTLGASELMNGNTLSGLIGFTRAMVTTLKLFIGTLLGGAIVRDWVSMPKPNVESGVPHFWTWVFIPLLVLGLAVLFHARRKDLVWPLLGGLVVWLGVDLGSGLGYWQGTFIGAFLLMSAARVFARVSKLPAAIILLPAVMVLVPGAATLRALYDAENLGLVSGLESMTRVFVLIAAILGGLQCGEAFWTIDQVAISTVTSKLFRREPGHP